MRIRYISITLWNPRRAFVSISPTQKTYFVDGLKRPILKRRFRVGYIVRTLQFQIMFYRTRSVFVEYKKRYEVWYVFGISPTIPDRCSIVGRIYSDKARGLFVKSKRDCFRFTVLRDTFLLLLYHNYVASNKGHTKINK